MTIFADFSPVQVELARILAHLDQLSLVQRRICLARKLSVPQRFMYKYRSVNPSSQKSIDHLHDIVVAGRLWLSSPLDFNDPFDVTAYTVVEGTAEERKARLQKLISERAGHLPRTKRLALTRQILSQPDETLLKTVTRAYRDNLAKVGLCCFAGDPRSILMWSHYGNQHTGVCLQFNVARHSSMLAIAGRVKYTEAYPVINWNSAGTDQLSNSVFSKFEDWKYEKEFRLFHPHGAHMYAEIRPEALTGVILGCRATPETRKALDTLLAERVRRQMPPVTLYRAKRHDRQYKLIIERAS